MSIEEGLPLFFSKLLGAFSLQRLGIKFNLRNGSSIVRCTLTCPTRMICSCQSTQKSSEHPRPAIFLYMSRTEKKNGNFLRRRAHVFLARFCSPITLAVSEEEAEEAGRKERGSPTGYSGGPGEARRGKTPGICDAYLQNLFPLRTGGRDEIHRAKDPNQPRKNILGFDRPLAGSQCCKIAKCKPK